MPDAGENLGVASSAPLAALGTCLRGAGEYRTAWCGLMRAIDRTSAAGDVLGLACAMPEATTILTNPARYQALGDRDPHLAALLCPLRSGLACPPGTEEGRAHRARARALAERHGCDDRDAAERDFGATLAWAASGRPPIEAGRYLQGLADVAGRRGRHAEARAARSCRRARRGQ